MPYLSRNSRWLLGVVVLACALGRVAAAGEFGPAGPPVGFGAPPAETPGHWNHQRSAAQPLDGSAVGIAVSQSPPALQYPETAASGAAELIAPASANAPRPIDAAQPLPLAPPAGDAPGEARRGEMPALVTGAASLGIVLGLFLLVVWVARRGMPKSAAMLPRDVFEILGRAPFIGRQNVHLVRCGHKLLLVHVTPTAAQTLTEITESAEVERLVDACQGPAGGSAFKQILQQFGSPPRDRRYFERREAAELDFGHLEAAHKGG